MTAINIKAFRGKVPRTSERLLDGNYATEALNCRVTSGRLDPIRGLALTHTSALAGAIATMFRYRNAGLEYWLLWNKTVDVVRSPTAQDAKNRVYWTGDGEPKMAAFADAIQGGGPYPSTWFVLGVYVPTVAPTVGQTGGTGSPEIRSYVYTFNTPYKEESGPSPPTVLSGFINSTSWNLSNMEVPPPNTGTVTGAFSLSSTTVRVSLNTNRGLSEYEELTFAGVTGMTSLNGTFPVAPVAGSSTQVDVALTTVQTYTAGGTWARRAPHNTAGMTRRIYRTVGTNTDYKLVAEIDATVTTYTDTIASTNLGLSIPTMDSFPPPKNGHSVVALANGSHAMVAGNQLCLSEQYKPYSYPQKNRYTFSGTGVAAAAAGNAVIVATDERPVVYSASVPEAASPNRLPTSMPCVCKAGAIDIGGGLVYPSNEGLILLTSSSAQNLTEKLYRNREWRGVTPATFRAAYYDQTYIALHTDAASGKQRLLMLDTNEPDSIQEIDITADGLFANPFDGRLYVSQGNKIYEFDADDSRRYVTFWQSAEFQFGPAIKLTTAQVHADYEQIVPPDTSVAAANAALIASGAANALGAFGDELGYVPWGDTNLIEPQSATANRVQFMLLQNGEVIFATDLSSPEPFRCDVAERSELYQVQIAASIPIHSISVAQGIRELGKVSG